MLSLINKNVVLVVMQKCDNVHYKRIWGREKTQSIDNNICVVLHCFRRLSETHTRGTGIALRVVGHWACLSQHRQIYGTTANMMCTNNIKDMWRTLHKNQNSWREQKEQSQQNDGPECASRNTTFILLSKYFTVAVILVFARVGKTSFSCILSCLHVNQPTNT